MADRKITDLTALAAGSQATGDLVTIVDVSESAAADKNKKMTVENLFKGIPGDVGIGTSAPSQKLHIFEATDGDVGIRIQNNDGFAELEVDADELNYNADSHVFNNQADSSEFMRINSSGNLGLGTASPDSPFHVKDSANTVARFESTDSVSRIVLKDNAGEIRVGATGDNLTFHTSSSETERARIDSSGRLLVGTTSALDTTAGAISSNNSSSGGRLALGGNPSGAGSSVGEVFGWWNANKVAGLVIASGADTTNKDDGELLFYTSASGPSVQERMRITRSGLVGVGDNAPGQKFVVKDAGNSTTSAYINVISGSAANAGIAFGDTNADLEGGILYNHSDDALRFFKNGFTEATRIDSSGRLLVGHTSSLDNAGVQSNLQVIGTNAATASLGLRRDSDNGSGPLIIFGKSRSSSKGGNTVVQNGDTLGLLLFCGGDNTDVNSQGAEIKVQVDGTPGGNDLPTRIVFGTTSDGGTSASERMRIDSSGNIGINTTDIDARLTLNGTLRFQTGNNPIALLTGDGDGTNCFKIDSNSAVGNGSGLVRVFNNGTQKARIEGDGGFQSAANSYGALSDISLKENIVDANLQWADIKNIQVRNYNFKEAVGHGTSTHLGVIAQEVETVSPGLVKTDSDGVKSVKYSVLYMKAVKALQEAMNRIEALETKVAALEAQ